MASDTQHPQTLILTRSYQDCQKCKSDYEMLGFFVKCFPLIKPVRHSVPELFLDPRDGLMITSQNALPALRSLADSKMLKVFCVGKTTADRLAQLGYHDVSSAPTASSLEDVILKTPIKRLVYLRADQVKVPLHRLLGAKGIDVEQHIVYSIEPQVLDKSDFIKVLGKSHFPIMTFYSMRTLEIFSEQVTQHGVDLSQSIAVVIYDDLTLLANQVGFGTVITAVTPCHYGFLEVVKHL